MKNAFYSKDFVRLLYEINAKMLPSIEDAHTIEKRNRAPTEKTQARLDAIGLDGDELLKQLHPIPNKIKI